MTITEMARRLKQACERCECERDAKWMMVFYKSIRKVFGVAHFGNMFWCADFAVLLLNYLHTLKPSERDVRTQSIFTFAYSVKVCLWASFNITMNEVEEERKNQKLFVKCIHRQMRSRMNKFDHAVSFTDILWVQITENVAIWILR